MHTSVITLTHNKLDVTRRCLTTLLDTAAGFPWELVVVDNGSSDGTPDWLEQFRAEGEERGVRVRPIFFDRNIGCCTARNRGLEEAEGDYVTFIDNDIALRTRQWLRLMAGEFEHRPDTALVGPKLVYPFPPYNIQCAGAAVAPTGRIQFRGRGKPRDTDAFNQSDDVQCLISACFMGRRKLLKDAGGFDEAFNPVEFEDIDLCYRLRSMGYRIRYTPDVEMYHFESVTTQGTPSLPNTSLIVRNGLLFKKRWQHMFAHENGPSDEEARWRHLPQRDFSEITELPVVEREKEDDPT